jgi:protein gp37
MHPDWARSLRDQCARDRVPFFFKQWGEWEPRRGFACPDDLPRDGWHHFDPECSMRRVGKKNAGRLLDGREWNDVPITKGPCGE